MAIIDAILDAALGTFLILHRAERGNVQVHDVLNGRSVLVIKAQRGFEAAFLKSFQSVDFDDDTACARAVREKRTIAISNVDLEPRFAPYREFACIAGFRSVISTPLILTNGQAVGCLSAHFPEPINPDPSNILRGESFCAGLASRIQLLLEPEGQRRSQRFYPERAVH